MSATTIDSIDTTRSLGVFTCRGHHPMRSQTVRRTKTAEALRVRRNPD
nr:MAG TPA: hypothetical protein [Caudoviricetes sp.]